MPFHTRLLARYGRLAVLLTLLLTAAAVFVQYSSPPWVRGAIDRMDALLYDMKARAAIPRPISSEPPIVIVDIDERSLKQEGRWPWPRSKLARLVERLAEGNALLVVFDLVMSEPEMHPADHLSEGEITLPEELAQWLDTHRPAWDSDLKLSLALGHVDAVLGTLFHEETGVQAGRLVAPDIDHRGAGPLDVRRLGVHRFDGFAAPLESLMRAAIGIGAINVVPDPDGVVRRAALMVEYGGRLYPSLPLEAARQYLLEEAVRVYTADIEALQAITHFELGGRLIPTDATGSILVPYMGLPGTFATVSSTDVLRDDAALALVDNAIVLVGTSALALGDLRPTPVKADFPGIEIQASVLHGLLHPDLLVSEPDWIPGAVVILLAGIGLLLLVFMPLIAPFLQPLLGATLALLAVVVNYWIWDAHKVNFPLFTQMLLIFVSTTAFTVEGLIMEAREKRRIRTSFGQYVPQEHIARLQGRGWRGTLTGERREMTVLFSDIRDFTRLSEGLDAARLREFLNHYLTPITRIVFATDGTIDKYVGDMVMAFWNAPLDDADHARHAVESALKMQRKIEQMQPELRRFGVAKVAAGIGINTGEMNVGDMGSEYRLAYTVLGDAVNLGSRLEGLTKFYGVPILVSEATKAQCPELAFRYVDRVRVKGKEESVRVFQPLDSEMRGDSQGLAAYEAAIGHYLARRWAAAVIAFAELAERAPDERLYRLYLERARQLQQSPPDSDWDGVFVHTSK